MSTNPQAAIVFEALTDSQATELARDAAGPLAGSPRLTEAIQKVLAPIVQMGPDGAKAIAERGKYLVEFSAQGQDALEATVLKFLERRDGHLQPTLVGRTGEFAENAVLAGNAVKKVAAAAAVVHVAILLAVQAQLLVIEGKLESIERKVDEIRVLLDQQKVAEVRGRLRVLQRIRDEMAANEWTSENVTRWKIALDQAEVEFHQIGELCRLQRADAEKAMRAANLGVRFLGSKSETLVAEFDRHVARYRQHEELSFTCLLGRAVVYSLLAGLTSTGGVEALRADVEHAIREAADHEQLLIKKSLEVTTIFRRRSYEVAARNKILDDGQQYRVAVEQRLQALRDEMSAADRGRPRLARIMVDVREQQVQAVTMLK